MKHLYNHRTTCLGIGIFVLMLMVACADEHEDATTDTLQLLTYSKALEEPNATRAVSLPEGYEGFAAQHPEISTENTSIGLFLAGATASSLRRIVYDGDHWESHTKVKVDEDYHIFGYVPVEAAGTSRITPLQANYGNGAILHIDGVKSLSDRDLCILTGLQGAESPEADVSLTPGNFAYTAKDKGLNYVYMLFDHFYAAVQFSICVEEQYAALRTIRMKSVVLKTDGAAKSNVSVPIRSNTSIETTIGTIISTPQGTEKGEMAVLDTEQELTTSYEPLGHICYFTSSNVNTLTLVTTYDVYDSKNRLIRTNCVSENKLDMLKAVGRGQKRNVKLTVNPTYLYQLSDQDLDNPTVVAN